WIRTNFQQVEQGIAANSFGVAVDRAGDMRQHCVPLVRFEHVRGLICGYRSILVDLLNQINTRRRKSLPPSAVAVYRTRGQDAIAGLGNPSNSGKTWGSPTGLRDFRMSLR